MYVIKGIVYVSVKIVEDISKIDNDDDEKQVIGRHTIWPCGRVLLYYVIIKPKSELPAVYIYGWVTILQLWFVKIICIDWEKWGI